VSLALQLYSLRRETAANPAQILRQVPALGYDAVELAGDYGWSVEKWRSLLDETGLKLVGAHCRLGEMDFDFHRRLGTPRLIVPSLPRGLDYREAARQLRALNAEFPVLYHNHAHEFADGGMDILLAASGFQLEVDTHWVEHAGQNAADFLRQHAHRVGMIHAKDFPDVPAGQGRVNFPAILALARQHGWPVVVEYEADNALAAVAESARYLKSCQSV
jgi:sugar phosphate isomerase/epimerase